MILSCPACPKTYDVPAAALPPGGREVECSACGTVWFERGHLARAVAVGAAGADVAPAWDDVIDAEFQAVGRTEPRPAPRPAPRAAEPDAMPAPSPAKAHQTALTVAYASPPDEADVPSAEAAREAAALLAARWRGHVRALRDALIAGAGFALGTILDLRDTLTRTEASPGSATPGDAAARATRDRMRARAVNAMTPARALGWTAWAAAVGAVVFVLTAREDAVRAAFPPAQALYAIVTPPPAPPGLSVTGELRTYAVSSQGPAVMVTGLVRNEGTVEAVPTLTMTVAAADGAATQPIALPAVPLPPGGERPFAVRALVPEGASSLRLDVTVGAAAPREGFALQAQGDDWGGYAGPPALEPRR